MDAKMIRDQMKAIADEIPLESTDNYLHQIAFHVEQCGHYVQQLNDRIENRRLKQADRDAKARAAASKDKGKTYRQRKKHKAETQLIDLDPPAETTVKTVT